MNYPALVPRERERERERESDERRKSGRANGPRRERIEKVRRAREEGRGGCGARYGEVAFPTK